MGLAKEVYQRQREPGGSRFKGLAAEHDVALEVQRVARAKAWGTDIEDMTTSLARLEWGALRTKWQNCDRCPLSCERNKVVIGEGTRASDILVVGEAPGEQEDKYGRPFVGPAGVLIRRVCLALGLDMRHDALVTNRVACRPPNNRKPHAAELKACLPRLEAMANLLRPRAILLLGATAAAWAGLPDVGKHRGLVPREQWPVGLTHGVARLRAVVLTYHPSWVLRQETTQAKRIALAKLCADLRKLRNVVLAAREEDTAYEAREEAKRIQAARRPRVQDHGDTGERYE